MIKPEVIVNGKKGIVRYIEVFYCDLDNSTHTPQILRKYIKKWRTFFKINDLVDDVNRHVNFLGYCKNSSLLFTFNHYYYRLLPEMLDINDEQYFDTFLYELITDLKEIGATQIKSTAMID